MVKSVTPPLCLDKKPCNDLKVQLYDMRVREIVAQVDVLPNETKPNKGDKTMLAEIFGGIVDFFVGIFDWIVDFFGGLFS